MKAKLPAVCVGPELNEPFSAITLCGSSTVPVQLQATVEPAVTDTDAGEKAKPRGSPTTVTDALRGAGAGVGVAGGGCGAVVAVAIAATVGGTVAIVAAGVGTVGLAVDALVGTVPADADGVAALAGATLPVAGDAVVEAAGPVVCDFNVAGCDAAGSEVGSWPLVFEDPPPQLKARQAQAIATTLANLPFLRNPCGEPQRIILAGGDCWCCSIHLIVVPTAWKARQISGPAGSCPIDFAEGK